MAATAYFNRFSSYCRMVAHAKSLANRSILIDHGGVEHIDLDSELKNVEHVYTIEKETRRGFTKMSLIEFASGEDAERVVKQVEHHDGLLPVPLKILRYSGRHTTTQAPSSLTTNLPYPVENYTISLSRESSTSFNSYTELISNYRISLVALKLRFVTLVNFERILCSGMFQEYELMPFGSSVLGSGCESGDLDLIFIRKVDHYNAIINRSDSRQLDPESSPISAEFTSKLKHLGKSLHSETKDSSGFRGAMRWFDHVLREYMPLTDGHGVITLHRAKVPIIKFTSRITDIDCDLSFDLGLDYRDSSISPVPWIHHGILMTEILYHLSHNNNLISSFVIYSKIFAKLCAITSKVPNTGMTNFQFLSMVIFFLQNVGIRRYDPSTTSHQEDNPIGDTSQDSYRARMATRNGEYRIVFLQAKDQHEAIVPAFRNFMNGSFLKNPGTPTIYTDEELNQILPNLIKKFFKFYSTYEFAKHSMNLYDARRDKKLDNSPVFVLNPIDRTRNICHNVNRKTMDTFASQVMSASIKNQDPLQLIRGMMIKHQRQAAKNRSLGLEDFDEPFTAEGIAQDVCS